MLEGFFFFLTFWGKEKKCCILKFDVTGHPGEHCHGGGHVWWGEAGHGKAIWPHPCLCFCFSAEGIFLLLRTAEAATPQLRAVCLEVLFRLLSLFKLRETQFNGKIAELLSWCVCFSV